MSTIALAVRYDPDAENALQLFISFYCSGGDPASARISPVTEERSEQGRRILRNRSRPPQRKAVTSRTVTLDSPPF
eukprot:NODE_23964_length_644_cov_3.288201.p1 GENE.NODE_23964_length_644_cov_3.288201~~NODE_23964_length_644_cov_3.288201.p1  ORF type:complete len:76 (-),score=11.03 NODE_23964_length_644_cov_3.288201:21-248(-)